MTRLGTRVIVVGLLLGLGFALGIWLANSQQGDEVAEDPAETPASLLPPLPPAGVDPPIAVVPEESFDFGVMEHDAKQSHAFTIRNEGGYKLLLAKGETSCKCTLSGIKNNEIPPGESGEIVLQWTAKSERSTFEQSAIIYTNDPARREIRLHISGHLQSTLELKPTTLGFAKNTDEEVARATELYSPTEDAFQITRWELENASEAPELVNGFDVQWEALAEDALAELAAKSGWLVKVTLKPGLPVGASLFTILLHHDIPEVPPVRLEMSAVVRGDIAVLATTAWNEYTNVLNLGTFHGPTGGKKSFKLLLRGPNHESLVFELKKVEPAWLQVELSQPEPYRNGKASNLSITVAVPKGTKPAAFVGPSSGGYGKILLGTTHPEIPEFLIELKFAISN